MKFHVFHLDWGRVDADSILSARKPEGAQRLLAAGAYVRVASLEAEDLNAVFRLTNSIDSAWYENPDVAVEAAFAQGARSTSVGDIFEQEDGQCFLVAPIGFKALTPDREFAPPLLCPQETQTIKGEALLPGYRARRPLDDEAPEGYLESDRDYVDNNLALAVRLLDAHGAALKDGAGPAAPPASPPAPARPKL